MSETREPIYLELDYDEDFKLDAHVDTTGQQRFVATGYIQKQRADGLYRAPLIPQLFFGADGSQLSTWSQYLTVGDHTILRRDSGNPYIQDNDLAWHKVAGAEPQVVQSPTFTRVAVPMDLTLPIMFIVGAPIVLYVIYKLWWKNK